MRRCPCCCDPEPGDWRPNMTWLADDLAVGGRVLAERVGHLADRLGIGAVVDLRAEDRDDAAHLALHGIDFLHLPTDDHGALTPEALGSGVAFAAEARAAGRRLLVHCEHGIGRSATLALAVMVERGWDPLAALRHCKNRRAVFSPSPAQYGCWTAWLAGRPGPVAIPTFAAFQAIAYRHLVGG